MADETSPNYTEIALPGREEEAALLVAEDDLTDEQIAERVGITKRSLELWKKRPHFAARVVQHKEAFKDRALVEGFADKRARLKALNALAQDLMRDMAEPATDLKPKGTYRKEIKLAADGTAVDYEVFDKDKATTFRGYLDDIASEMGERKTIAEVTGKDGEPLVLGLVGVDVGKI